MMNQPEVLITDCDHADVETEARLFHEASVSYELKQCQTEEDLIEQGKGSRVFINQYAPITEAVLSQLPDLSLVVRYGVGVNNVDLEAASRYNVQVCNVPDYGMNEVADHALALLLNFTRKIELMNDKVREGVWDYQESAPIYRHSDQTVGIIGLGRIGTSFANKVKALGCRVIGYDPKFSHEFSKESVDGVEMVSLQDLLIESDAVSIHCPLDKAHHLIDEQELKMMKPSAYLLNVSRGGIINEIALDKALQEKWIAGAGVDVASIEPLPADHSLFKHRNFVCTPHMAWYSEQAALELKRKVAEEASRFLKGEQVHYPVNQIHIKEERVK
ncbi:C-terminal binding protein [Halobacillus shinanisalinarum]|uniref:C-terminal binding protein n=1 Tax=Halobacillus shinanisalinarum TaxID=2932258 RepID=A0ABY4GYS8_9BACI|nr:C-terminal binding protein [Halobacillus shinanisalinarum]UOQ93357.1 C-terminal binding protein [Halobacillus shinanisalinarum]